MQIRSAARRAAHRRNLCRSVRTSERLARCIAQLSRAPLQESGRALSPASRPFSSAQLRVAAASQSLVAKKLARNKSLQPCRNQRANKLQLVQRTTIPSQEESNSQTEAKLKLRSNMSTHNLGAFAAQTKRRRIGLQNAQLALIGFALLLVAHRLVESNAHRQGKLTWFKRRDKKLP